MYQKHELRPTLFELEQYPGLELIMSALETLKERVNKYEGDSRG
jgi:hypothetical protein